MMFGEWFNFQNIFKWTFLKSCENFFSGGYVWGAIGDVAGRKPTLIVALICNGIFGSLCGVSQTFNFLLAMRFLSGFRYLNKTLVFNVYLKKRFFTSFFIVPVAIIRNFFEKKSSLIDFYPNAWFFAEF